MRLGDSALNVLLGTCCALLAVVAAATQQEIHFGWVTSMVKSSTAGFSIAMCWLPGTRGTSIHMDLWDGDGERHQFTHAHTKNSFSSNPSGGRLRATKLEPSSISFHIFSNTNVDQPKAAVLQIMSHWLRPATRLPSSFAWGRLQPMWSWGWSEPWALRSLGCRDPYTFTESWPTAIQQKDSWLVIKWVFQLMTYDLQHFKQPPLWCVYIYIYIYLLWYIDNVNL